MEHPGDPEIRHYLFRVEVKAFIESQLTKAGVDLLLYRSMELGKIARDHKTRTAKSAAVKAASNKYHKGNRWIYDLIRPNPEWEKYCKEYLDGLAREATARAQLTHYYSVDECADLYRLEPELLQKLAVLRCAVFHDRRFNELIHSLGHGVVQPMQKLHPVFLASS